MEQTIPSKTAVRYPNNQYEVESNGQHSNQALSSGVSWAPVIAGALTIAALSLVLLALGTGLGLSSISVWSNVGASARTIGVAGVVWIILVQIMSSSTGGYLAGRLRTKCADIHNDEVYFRDTAHGFLAWAVALILTAAFLTSAANTVAGTAVSPILSGADATSEQRNSEPIAYFVDSLFRPENAKLEQDIGSARVEFTRILANSLRSGEMSAADQSYLAQSVGARAGLSQGDAEKRVSDIFDAAKQSAESTRKVIARGLLWTFLALLIGAFCASYAATIGGRQRDHVTTV